MKVLKSWSELSGGGRGGGGRRSSARSDPGRGWDVPVGVISEAGECGEGDKDLPPVLRKLGTGSGSRGSPSPGRGRASSRGKGISAVPEIEPVLTDLLSEELPRRQHRGDSDSSPALAAASARASSTSSSAGPMKKSISSSSHTGTGDFWNPLGLMSEDAQQPQPSRGSRRGVVSLDAGARPRGGRGDGTEGDWSQHSPSSSSSRRSSGRGLSRGVKFASVPSPGGRAEGSSRRSTARAPDDAE